MAEAKVAVRQRLQSTRLCVICCHDCDFFVLGLCGHPVCFECGTRMRAICDSRDCPICRKKLTQVWPARSIQ